MAQAFVLPLAPLWELFSISSEGQVVHSWYPETRAGGPVVGTEVIGRDAKPGGQLDVIRQVTPEGAVSRADVWAEADAGDGFLHWYQDAPNDYRWHGEDARW